MKGPTVSSVLGNILGSRRPIQRCNGRNMAYKDFDKNLNFNPVTENIPVYRQANINRMQRKLKNTPITKRVVLTDPYTDSAMTRTKYGFGGSVTEGDTRQALRTSVRKLYPNHVITLVYGQKLLSDDNKGRTYEFIIGLKPRERSFDEKKWEKRRIIENL